MSPSATTAKAPALQLPPTLVGRPDAARLIREMEHIENVFASAALRRDGQSVGLPPLSQMLSDLTAINRIDLLQAGQRSALTETLHQIKDHAPIMHVSFAVEAAPDVLQQLAAWVRQEVHPHALLRIGLQPSLIAGAVVRTPSHIYNFGLAHRLEQQKAKLIEAIKVAPA